LIVSRLAPSIVSVSRDLVGDGAAVEMSENKMTIQAANITRSYAFETLMIPYVEVESGVVVNAESTVAVSVEPT
jgi:hypothetical protein